MKIVMFDLGDTLEHQDVLLPGARETLQAIQAMRGSNGEVPILTLVSNFGLTDDPKEIPGLQQQYYAVLDQLGIRSFFEPVAEKVTLSPEVGVEKPDERIFRAAIDKVDENLGFQDVIFVTENLEHVAAARTLKMRAIHFKGPGQMVGDVAQLVDLIPLIQKFVGTAYIKG